MIGSLQRRNTRRPGHPNSKGLLLMAARFQVRIDNPPASAIQDTWLVFPACGITLLSEPLKFDNGNLN